MAMTVTTSQWRQIGTFSDGNPTMAIDVCDGGRMIGMIVDLRDGHFQAHYVEGENLIGVITNSFHDAVVRIAEESAERRRHLH